MPSSGWKTLEPASLMLTKTELRKKDHFVFDSYQAFNIDDLPTTDLPEHYVPSPSQVRRISVEERQQPGHGHWDGPSGRIFTGYAYTQETTCTPEYLESRGYSANKNRREKAPGYNEQNRKKSDVTDGSHPQALNTPDDGSALQVAAAISDDGSEEQTTAGSDDSDDGSGLQVPAATPVDDSADRTAFLPTEDFGDLASTWRRTLNAPVPKDWQKQNFYFVIWGDAGKGKNWERQKRGGIIR